MLQCEKPGCGRRFRKPRDFEEHGRSCRPISKFKCSDVIASYCKYSCLKLETLQKHLEAKHDTTLFSCEKDPKNCRYSTLSFPRLADHILTVHDKPPEIENFGFGPGYDSFLQPGAAFPIPILFDDQPCSLPQSENHTGNNYVGDLLHSYRSSPHPPESSLSNGGGYLSNYNPQGICPEWMHLQDRYYC